MTTVQTIQNNTSIETDHSENAAINTLYDELAQGIQSMRNGQVFTVKEAWEEIDKI